MFSPPIVILSPFHAVEDYNGPHVLLFYKHPNMSLSFQLFNLALRLFQVNTVNTMPCGIRSVWPVLYLSFDLFLPKWFCSSCRVNSWCSLEYFASVDVQTKTKTKTKTKAELTLGVHWNGGLFRIGRRPDKGQPVTQVPARSPKQPTTKTVFFFSP